jgi:hypothetical protein
LASPHGGQLARTGEDGFADGFDRLSGKPVSPPLHLTECHIVRPLPSRLPGGYKARLSSNGSCTNKYWTNKNTSAMDRVLVWCCWSGPMAALWPYLRLGAVELFIGRDWAVTSVSKDGTISSLGGSSEQPDRGVQAVSRLGEEVREMLWLSAYTWWPRPPWFGATLNEAEKEGICRCGLAAVGNKCSRGGTLDVGRWPTVHTVQVHHYLR